MGCAGRHTKKQENDEKCKKTIPGNFHLSLQGIWVGGLPEQTEPKRCADSTSLLQRCSITRCSRYNARQSWNWPREPSSGHTKSSARSAQAAWAKSTVRATLVSIAASR